MRARSQDVIRTSLAHQKQDNWIETMPKPLIYLLSAGLLALGPASLQAVEVGSPDVEIAEASLQFEAPEDLGETDSPSLDSVPASGAEFLRRAGQGEVGVASFYSMEFAGRRTASGHPFDPLGMTAAHKTLPLGTEIRITNLRNGRSVTATVNDRGPYVQGRIVDVSLALARQLDFVRAGMAQVKVEVLNWGPIRQLRSKLSKGRR